MFTKMMMGIISYDINGNSGMNVVHLHLWYRVRGGLCCLLLQLGMRAGVQSVNQRHSQLTEEVLL